MLWILNCLPMKWWATLLCLQKKAFKALTMHDRPSLWSPFHRTSGQLLAPRATVDIPCFAPGTRRRYSHLWSSALLEYNEIGHSCNPKMTSWTGWEVCLCHSDAVQLARVAHFFHQTPKIVAPIWPLKKSSHGMLIFPGPSEMKPCNSVTQCTKEEIITMLEDQLVPNATEAEAKIFFLKNRADSCQALQWG